MSRGSRRGGGYGRCVFSCWLKQASGTALTPGMAATTFSFGTHGSLAVVCVPLLRTPPLAGAPGGAGDSTGQLAWPGARALCRALLAYCPELRGAVCVELGCGSGVVSAAAAALCGAAFVLATDGAPAALPLAAATLAANAVPPSACSVALLPWGAEHAAPLVALHLGGRRCRVVLASECVYPSSATESIEALFATAAALLLLPLPPAGGAPPPPPAVAGSCDPAAPALLMSYVPRAPETTQRLCAAAWRGGWAWEALGPAAARGEGEAGAVVLRFTARPAAHAATGTGGGWEDLMDAAFPGARESARAAREYAMEAEAERASWGPPMEVLE